METPYDAPISYDDLLPYDGELVPPPPPIPPSDEEQDDGLSTTGGGSGGYLVPIEMVGSLNVLYPPTSAHVPDLVGEDYRVKERREKSRRIATALAAWYIMSEDH